MSIARYMYSLYSEHSEVVKEAFIGVEKRETEQLTLPYYLLFPGESCVLLILYSSTKLILRCEHSSFKQLFYPCASWAFLYCQSLLSRKGCFKVDSTITICNNLCPVMPSRGSKLPKKQIHVEAGMHVIHVWKQWKQFQNGRQKNVYKESPLTGSYSQASLSLDSNMFELLRIFPS